MALLFMAARKGLYTDVLGSVHSPLTQFEVAPLFSFVVLGVDLSITNLLLASLISLATIPTAVWAAKEQQTQTMFVVPSGWQLIIERVYQIAAELLVDILGRSNQRYLPILTLVFTFVLTNNVVGLIPYNFTVTSHITVTFFVSFSVFIGINIVGFEKHGIALFSLFLPSNTNTALALLLVPIEFVSYIAKPISLGVRLFVNLMAGHSLLKIVAGFAWNLLLLDGVKSLIFLLPVFVLVLLLGLELGVALVQAYVFLTLILLYLNDVESLHQ